MSAGSEVAVPDPRLPPGTTHPINTLSKVFVLAPESGKISFGDGLRGMRPPAGAIMRVDYAYSMGSGGNVGTGSISSIPVLSGGFVANNPLPTWGGTDAETIDEGEKHISRYLQHRDRLVNVADFEAITLRTPGVDIGRVDVIPTFHPELAPNQAGDAPGAVTLMVIPRYDPLQPDAPQANDQFLAAICAYLDPRRLVTTEVFVRGPIYKPIWVSIGINVIAGTSIAQVREAVKSALIAFLSPLPANPDVQLDDVVPILGTQQPFNANKGWPRGKTVLAAELAAVASRVPGVVLVNDVLLTASTTSAPQVEMNGLELPRIAGIAVTVGNALDLAQLQGQSTPMTQTPGYMPIPVIPEECQ
jgi:predicted phage baseplate assembly protein